MLFKSMFTFLRDLFVDTITFAIGFLIYFGIPGVALAMFAFVLGVTPGNSGWLILLLIVGASWVFLLSDPPSFLQRLLNWYERF